MLRHKMAIVLRPQICDVISPYVYQSDYNKKEIAAYNADHKPTALHWYRALYMDIIFSRTVVASVRLIL